MNLNVECVVHVFNTGEEKISNIHCWLEHVRNSLKDFGGNCFWKKMTSWIFWIQISSKRGLKCIKNKLCFVATNAMNQFRFWAF